MELNKFAHKLEVNKFAQRARHLRVFSRKVIIKTHINNFGGEVIEALSKVKNIPYLSDAFSFLSKLKAGALRLIPVSAQKRFVFNTAVISSVFVLTSSISFGTSYSSTLATDYSVDYIGAYALPSEILVTDDNGYLVKMNPQTDSGNRIGLTDFAVHTIESGETLSVIASRYGISVDTIKWQNSIGNANSIRVGQKLLIPPVNGISYTVKSGDTLDNVSKKYKIEQSSIIAQNNLAIDASLLKGQTIFLPGAKPIEPPPVVVNNTTTRNSTKAVSVRQVDYSTVESAGVSSATGIPFIYPTRGKITQGYKSGHYAIDIADTSKPPVWSAGAGTISKVSTGTWGGGYGNHIIVDHGDGLTSLYAHLDSVNVSQGQWVNQGDVIGIMGNTGRVYGVTGIHLHWEVTKNGVKQNPNNYY